MEKTSIGVQPLDAGCAPARGDAPRPLPRRLLFALTGVVLLGHLAVLGSAPLVPGFSPASAPQPTRAFTTRTLAFSPPRPVPSAPDVGAQVARPPPPRIARTGQPKPKQSSAPAHAAPAQMAPQAAPMAAAADPPTSPAQTEVAATVEPPTPADAVLQAPKPPRDALPTLNAAQVPAPVRLRYRVTANKFPFSLNSELLWQHDGQRFEARLAFSAFGQTRVQTSHGDITPEGLAPVRFSDKFRSEVAAHFDRTKGKVTFSANTPDAPLLAGAQDRLSLLLQLAALLASAPEAYPEATTLAIQTIGPREADTWLFTVGQTETLALPGGEQIGLKLVRHPRRAFDQRVELWLAPALGYLPVRVRITEADGNSIDQQWLASELPTQAPD